MCSSNIKKVFRKACNAVIIHFQSSDVRSVFKKINWKRFQVIIVYEPGGKNLKVSAKAGFRLSHNRSCLTEFRGYEVQQTSPFEHLSNNSGSSCCLKVEATCKYGKYSLKCLWNESFGLRQLLFKDTYSVINIEFIPWLKAPS